LILKSRENVKNFYTQRPIKEFFNNSWKRQTSGHLQRKLRTTDSIERY